MKIWEIIIILAVMYPFAVAGAQFITRFLKLNQGVSTKKIWGFSIPTKKELIYALLAVLGLGLYMFKAGFFK